MNTITIAAKLVQIATATVISILTDRDAGVLRDLTI